ncbi:MAG: SdpI family protein [Nanoarchaeota archaeon]|nr:SdpI family protein [Nanoarchaeota archaeon]
MTLLPNFGFSFNISYFVIPAIAILFYYMGHILKFIKKNFFIGIRTPWTLSSDDVWNKTHKLGSMTFKMNAIILLFALISPVIGFWIFIISVLVNVVFLITYSYYIWKKK